MDRNEYTSAAATQTPETPIEHALKPDRTPLLFPDSRWIARFPTWPGGPFCPIQNRASKGTLEGIVSLEDVLSRYQQQ